MVDGLEIERVLRRLRKLRRFSGVALQEYPEGAEEALFSAQLPRPQAAAILERLRRLPGAASRCPADDEIELVFREVLSPGLPADLDITIEMDALFGYAPGEAVAPTAVELRVQLPKPSPARNDARPPSRRPSTRPSPKSEAEVREAERRRKVRARSRKRRAEARAEREAKTGQKVRVGKIGYVTKRFDEASGLELWVPTTDRGRAVLQAADLVWKRGVETGGALARYLNAQGVKPLEGETFKRTMMPRVIDALVRYRRSRAVLRHHESAR